MRKLASVLFCLIAIVPAFSQDLSEFDKKGARTEVETKCFIQDFSAGDEEEIETFTVTRCYDLDGELRSRTTKAEGFSDNRVYLTGKDKDGRVIKRTEQRKVKIGDAESVPALRVWIYVYDETGAATVICTEVEEEPKDDDPEDPNPVQPMIISEIWKLDASGRALRYSLSLGDKENMRVEFERDKDGKLLTKTEASGELVYRKETYTYRDDGTLKESDELVSFTMERLKKEYTSAGEECNGEVVDKDGKILQYWTVHRAIRAKLPDGSLRDETTYWITGKDVERVVRTVRYVITTKQYK